MSVPDLAAAKEAGIKFGYPYMLKARKLAYDGKGKKCVLLTAPTCIQLVCKLF